MIYSNLFFSNKKWIPFPSWHPSSHLLPGPSRKNTKQQDTNRPKFYPTPCAPRLALPYPHLWCIHFRPQKSREKKPFGWCLTLRGYQIWGSRVVFHSEFKTNHFGETPWNFADCFSEGPICFGPEDWSQLEIIGLQPSLRSCRRRYFVKAFPFNCKKLDLVDWKVPKKIWKNEIWIINKLKPPEKKTTCSHPFNS